MTGEDRVRINADRFIVSTPDVYLPTVNFDIPHLEYLFTLQGCMRIPNIQGRLDLPCLLYKLTPVSIEQNGDPNSHDYNKIYSPDITCVPSCTLTGAVTRIGHHEDSEERELENGKASG